jgi:type II secretory pathway pseudopilin PulG
MKVFSAGRSVEVRRRGFTLLELTIAFGLGVGLAGTVVLLLVQTGYEQRRGFADTSVEESAYLLQTRIASCLRSMSSNQGLTPDYSSGTYDANGNLLGYQKVYVFQANTNGSYTTKQIRFDSSSGRVIYTPSVTTPATQIVWMTNGPALVLRQLCFSTSFDPDGSLNSSLVNVRFQMDDKGYSQQNPINNPASIYRSFSIQMRGD